MGSSKKIAVPIPEGMPLEEEVIEEQTPAEKTAEALKNSCTCGNQPPHAHT